MKTYNIFVFSYEELSDAAKLTVERNFKELAWDFPPSTFEGYNFTKDGDFCMLPSDAVPAPAKVLFSYDELSEKSKDWAREKLTWYTSANVSVLDFIAMHPGLLFLESGEFVNHLDLP